LYKTPIDPITIDSLMIFKIKIAGRKKYTINRIPTFHDDLCSWLIQSNGRKDQTNQQQQTP